MGKGSLTTGRACYLRVIYVQKRAKKCAARTCKVRFRAGADTTQSTQQENWSDHFSLRAVCVMQDAWCTQGERKTKPARLSCSTLAIILRFSYFARTYEVLWKYFIMRFMTEYVALAIGALISHASRATDVEIARDTYFFLHIKKAHASRASHTSSARYTHSWRTYHLLALRYSFHPATTLRLATKRRNSESALLQTRTTGCKRALML